MLEKLFRGLEKEFWGEGGWVCRVLGLLNVENRFLF